MNLHKLRAVTGELGLELQQAKCACKAIPQAFPGQARFSVLDLDSMLDAGVDRR